MTELTRGEPLPRRICLTGAGSLLPGLGKLLRTNPEPFDSAPEVTWLDQQSFFPLKDLTDSLDYNQFALTLGSTIGLPE
jgi:hypothetical protein